MKSKHLFITLLCATLMMTACRSSYKISSIERTRILIDSRYDKPLSKELDEYMEPFTHAVDSIKSPVVGKAAQYMSAKRPEGLLSNLLPDILMWAAKDYNEKPDFAVYNIGGIRAAVVSEPYSARMSREHNNSNIICFGARVVGIETAKDIVDNFLNTKFLGDKHLRRVNMITEIESGSFKS